MHGKSASLSRCDGQATAHRSVVASGERHQHLDDEWRLSNVDE